MRRLLPFLLVPTLVSAQESLYVGAEACRSCHPKAFEIWASSPHASAQSLLPPENRGTLRCLFCHATDAWKSFSDRRLEAVQCEACHGPGGRHAALASSPEQTSGKIGGLEAVSDRTCLRCHTDLRSPRLRPFDLERGRAAIRHWDDPRRPN